MGKKSLLLDTGDWDIHIDGSGNIRTTQGTYCTAQDVANAIQLFTQDAFLAAQDGVPHFIVELGKKPPLSVVRSRFESAAEEVDNVSAAQMTITDVDERKVSGYIDITTESGKTARVAV